MRTFAMALMAGVGALSLAGGAKAADVYVGSEYTNPDLVRQVRTVCDQDGRCYQTRGGRRVIIEHNYDSYNYVPRERYQERRYYRDRDYDEGPRAGVGIYGPGVSVGVGVGDRW
jgi:hypothetical protein